MATYLDRGWAALDSTARNAELGLEIQSQRKLQNADATSRGFNLPATENSWRAYTIGLTSPAC
jgi:hypothetical protein